MTVEERAELLTADVFSLDEPWRSRFLDLIANMATHWRGSAQQPTREEVAAWLGANPALCQQVKLLVGAWRGT